jgi:multidrug efflux pump subunit AcrA (membrane-fusion protein)
MKIIWPANWLSMHNVEHTVTGEDMKKWMRLLPGLLLVAGCSGQSIEATVPGNEAAVAYQEPEEAVVAEAVIEPAHWSVLGFKTGGEVIEVLVEEGDTVTAGDLLVRLDPTDAQLAVEQAETAVETAQAQLALLRANPRPEEVAAAEAQLKAAQATMEQATAQQDQLLAGATEAEIAGAKARVASAMAEQKVALITYDTTDKDDANKREQANYRLHAANEALVAAQAELDQALAGADANEIRTARASVSSAAAQVDAMQAQLDLVQAGAIAEEIAVAEAEVARAKVGVESAQAALAYTEVRAPFAGTVTAINVKVGNTVNPGQIACVLATLDLLQARTADLTELDVGQVTVGRPVAVTVDALPGQEIAGVVRQIALQAENFRGQVVYAVIVELTNVTDAPLRWGMTAWVEFEAP